MQKLRQRMPDVFYTIFTATAKKGDGGDSRFLVEPDKSISQPVAAAVQTLTFGSNVLTKNICIIFLYPPFVDHGHGGMMSVKMGEDED
jgi:hypothetical protein